jgi:hypothetical protein
VQLLPLPLDTPAVQRLQRAVLRARAVGVLRQLLQQRRLAVHLGP